VNASSLCHGRRLLFGCAGRVITKPKTDRSNQFADLTDHEQALEDIINPDTLGLAANQLHVIA